MHRPHAPCAVALLLCVCACDSRKDFSGRYEVSGTISLRQGSTVKESRVENEQFVIIADAFDSDRLYVDFDCGLSATMRDSESFRFETKTCPAYTVEGCSFTWAYQGGEGKLTEPDQVLDVRPGGTIMVRCADGSAGSAVFGFSLTGVRKNAPSSSVGPPGAQSRDTGSGEVSTLRSTVEQAMLRSLRR